MTPMSAEQRSMLRYWHTMTPTISVQSLAENLIRRFRLDKNAAWILAARFKNEL